MSGRNLYIATAVVLAAAAAGCFSLETARIPQSRGEHLLISNYGWYLFDLVPLACGNASSDRFLPCMVLRDDVKLDKMQKRFTGYASDMGYAVKSMTYRTHNSVMFEIPGMNFPLPVPYLLTYREVQLSGVLVPGDPGEGTE